MYLNALDIFFSWILSCVWSWQSLEESTPILRVILSFDVSNVFGGDSKAVRKFTLCTCVSCIESHLTYFGVSALVPGSDILGDICSCTVISSSTIRQIVWWSFFRAIDPKVLPDSWDFPKFSWGLLRDCERCPRKFVFCLLFFSSWDEEGFVGCLPFSPVGF